MMNLGGRIERNSSIGIVTGVTPTTSANQPLAVATE